MSETVRVRIAVVVDEYGDHGAEVWKDGNVLSMDWADHSVTGPSFRARYWIEAEIPVPNGPVHPDDATATVTRVTP